MTRLLRLVLPLVLAAAGPLVAPAAASAAVPAAVRTWSAGVVMPGESKSYVWNNANSDLYQVNAAGTRGAGLPCRMAVTAQSYSRTAAGARTFHLTVRNVDAASCDATVYLAPVTGDASGATATLNPGGAQWWIWYNSDLTNLVYLAGVTPDVPAAGTCRLESTWFSRVTAAGQPQFGWWVRNTGTVACSGRWKIGWLPVQSTTSFPAGDAPSPPGTLRALDSPVTTPYKVIVHGLVPGQTSAGDCDWAPVHLKQSGDPAVPTAGSRVDFGYRNAGSVPCTNRKVTAAYLN